VRIRKITFSIEGFFVKKSPTKSDESFKINLGSQMLLDCGDFVSFEEKDKREEVFW